MARTPTRLSRKLSSATITGRNNQMNRDLCASDPTKFFPLYSIVGTARGYRTGTSQHGDWMAVTGEFEATNLEDGEVHNGGRYFPPPYVCDLLQPALLAGDTNSAIECALVVGVKYADNAFGFEYVAESYIEPDENTAIKRLKNLVPTPDEILGITHQSDK